MRLAVQAALVPAAFITDFMPEAGGDYVKVYLYLLLDESGDTERIAEDLHLSEGDVRRAIRYWMEKGVLTETEDVMKKEAPEKEIKKKSTKEESDSLRERYMSTEGTEILARLSEDPTFTELLFIVQKYRSKIMDERESEVFAYLYDGLKLPADVLDYLVAYAVEHEHNSIRYIEKLGTDWAKIGIRDVDAAKRRTKQFEEDAKKAASGRTARSGKSPAAGSDRHTDYNELVLKELIEDLG